MRIRNCPAQRPQPPTTRPPRLGRFTSRTTAIQSATAISGWYESSASQPTSTLVSHQRASNPSGSPTVSHFMPWQAVTAFRHPTPHDTSPNGTAHPSEGLPSLSEATLVQEVITGKQTQRLRHTPRPPAAFARSSVTLKAYRRPPKPPMTCQSRITDGKRSRRFHLLICE